MGRQGGMDTGVACSSFRTLSEVPQHFCKLIALSVLCTCNRVFSSVFLGAPLRPFVLKKGKEAAQLGAQGLRDSCLIMHEMS